MSKRRVAIITGGSSGIGLATAEAMLRKDYAVILAARDVERLARAEQQCKQIGIGEVITLPTDVACRDQVESLVQHAVDRFGRLDVMVNNAGRGLFARVHETPEQDLRNLFEVNFYGVYYGCIAAAPIMMSQRSGHIFNVSSVIGKRGTPFHGGYCATKFAVCGLSDSMRVELKPYGVQVTAVLPTLTETDFFSRSPRGNSAGAASSRFTRMMSPQKVGQRITRTVGKNTPEMIFSLGGRFLALMTTIWPRSVDWMMRLYHNEMMQRI